MLDDFVNMPHFSAILKATMQYLSIHERFQCMKIHKCNFLPNKQPAHIIFRCIFVLRKILHEVCSTFNKNNMLRNFGCGTFFYEINPEQIKSIDPLVTAYFRFPC